MLSDYFKEAIEKLQDDITLCGSMNSNIKALKTEIEILEKHQKLYKEKKWGKPDTLGSVIVIENSIDYLKGFREGVMRVTRG